MCLLLAWQAAKLGCHSVLHLKICTRLWDAFYYHAYSYRVKSLLILNRDFYGIRQGPVGRLVDLTMSESIVRYTCVPGSDKLYGPRVSVDCRDFDFTFLFEDAILIILPAIIFLLLIPSRIQYLLRHPVQGVFHKLGGFKIVSTDRKEIRD